VGRAAIQAGADVVVGHHPHVVQGVEVYQGKPIFYSLGNFAFDWPKMRGRALDGLLVRCTVTGRALSSVSFVPVRRNQDNLVEVCSLESAVGRATLEDVRTLSHPFGTELVVEGPTVRVAGVGAARDLPREDSVTNPNSRGGRC